MGMAEIRLSCLRSLRISLAVDDAPLGVDALAHDWPDALYALYAFPSLSLIKPLLLRVREHPLFVSCKTSWIEAELFPRLTFIWPISRHVI